MVKVSIHARLDNGKYINYLEVLDLDEEQQKKMMELFEDSMIQTLNSEATIRVGRHIICPTKFVSFTIDFTPVEDDDESEEDTSD